MYAKSKPVPKTKAPGQESLFQKDCGYVSVSCLCSALGVGVVICQELPLQLLKSQGAHECKQLWPPEPGTQEVAATETKSRDIKTRAPGVYGSFSSGMWQRESTKLASSERRKKKERIKKEKKEIRKKREIWCLPASAR